MCTAVPSRAKAAASAGPAVSAEAAGTATGVARQAWRQQTGLSWRASLHQQTLADHWNFLQ